MNAREHAPDAEPSPEVRRAQFTRFFNRFLQQVRDERGWSIPKLAQESGVGKSTLYRWRDGDWSYGMPAAQKVASVLSAAGYDPSPALEALGTLGGRNDPAPEVDSELERYLSALLRQIRDPNVPQVRKVIIRATLEELARGADSAPSEGRNRSAG